MYDRYVTLQAPSWAETSTVHSSTWETAVLKRLDGWMPINGTTKILDLGCGPGNLILALKRVGYESVTGVDISPQSVALAVSKGCDVEQCDVISFLKNTPERWDVIIASDLVEHFTKDDLLEMLQEIEMHLTDGGCLIIQTPNAISPWASHLRYGDITHEVIFTPMSITSTLMMAGFSSVAVREVAPVPSSILSRGRWIAWKCIHALCALWNLVETGGTVGGIYTRNMLVKAEKRRP